MNSVSHLRTFSLFRDLSDDDLEKLSSVLHRRQVAAGTLVITAEQRGEALYLISRGSVRVFLDEANGAQVTVALLGSGDSVGEMSLIDEGGRSAHAMTLEDSELLWMDRRAFLDAVRHVPLLAHNLLRDLSQRLRLANLQIRSLVTLSVPERLARQLLLFCDRYGQTTEAGTRIPLPLHQNDLAELIGTSRESVNRAMSKLRKDGILKDSTVGLVILDRKRLAAHAAAPVSGITP
jgi:CRP-like cAMP-binding protein